MHILTAETNSRDYGNYQRFFSAKTSFPRIAKRFWQKKNRKLLQDFKVRWNFINLMLRRAYQLRKYIDI